MHLECGWKVRRRGDRGKLGLLLKYSLSRQSVFMVDVKKDGGDSLEYMRLCSMSFDHPSRTLCGLRVTGGLQLLERIQWILCFLKEWMIVRIGKVSEALKSQVMVSIDCEMVLCSDGTEAVARVCVVGQNLELKLNELAKPDKEICDYRSHITGTSAKDLEGVTCSLKDVHKTLKKLLSLGTILAGHSLHNDLRGCVGICSPQRR